MARGIFTLKQQLQGVREKSWNSPFGNTYGAKFAGSGSGQYLTGPTTSVLNFGTGNFTVEFWVYINAIPSSLAVIFSASNSTADWQLGYSSSNYFYWHNSGIQINSASTAPAYGRWTHVALIRSGTTVSLFCNGARVGTTTNSAAVNLTNFNIGSYWTGPTSYMVDGWISNLRVTNTVVYDPALTMLVLPTGPLTAISGTQLLTLQNATIIDNSTNALTITNNGSVATQIVNPFGIQLQTPAVDYLVVAGGGAGGGSYGSGGGAGGLLQGNISIITGSAITVTVGGGGTGVSNANGNSGNNSVLGTITAIGGGYGVSGYGNQAGSGGSGGGSSGNSTGHNKWGQPVFGQGNRGGDGGDGTGPAQGGGGGAGTPGLNGISEQPAGNGGAGIASVITGTVTGYAGGGGGGCYNRSTAVQGAGGFGGGGAGGVSTATNNGTAGTANTGGGGGGSSFVTSGSPSGGNGGSGIVVLSYPDVYAGATATTGSPVVSTSGSGSILFNGTSQYLSIPTNTGLNFSTGDFTVETWVNTTTANAADFFIVSGTGSGGFFFGWNSGGSYGWGRASVAWDYATGATRVNGTWIHLALTRSGTSMRMFVNGTQVGTTQTNSTAYDFSIGSTAIGWQTGAYYFPGYMTNLRIIKGTALYTSNFIPSTIPLTAVSGTSLLLNAVSGSPFVDRSGTGLVATATTANSPAWNQASPFATGLGYKNRVYTYTSSGTITF